jgi:hypothetical protein
VEARYSPRFEGHSDGGSVSAGLFRFAAAAACSADQGDKREIATLPFKQRSAWQSDLSSFLTNRKLKGQWPLVATQRHGHLFGE